MRGENLEEASEGRKICISYSTSQICLLWPLASACPLTMLSPLFLPLLALVWGVPWEGSVADPSAAGITPGLYQLSSLVTALILLALVRLAMTGLCCRSRDSQKANYKHKQVRGEGTALPSPLLLLTFHPGQVSPIKHRWGIPAAS